MRRPEVMCARKVVAYELLSLDGVAESPEDFFTDWDDAMDVNLAEVVAVQDTFILGSLGIHASISVAQALLTAEVSTRAGP